MKNFSKIIQRRLRYGNIGETTCQGRLHHSKKSCMYAFYNNEKTHSYTLPTKKKDYDVG